MPVLVDENELEQFLMESWRDGYFPIDEKFGKLNNQVSIMGYGIIDILGTSFSMSLKDENKKISRRNINIKITATIFELKKDVIDHRAVAQISRYKTGVEKILKYFQYRNNIKRYDYEVNGILIGSGYPENSEICFLVDNCEWLRMFKYEICMYSGLLLEESNGWYKTNFDIDSFEIPQDIKSRFIGSYLKKETFWNKFFSE